MEDYLMYVCPDCRKVFKIKGSGKKAKCPKCMVPSMLKDLGVIEEDWKIYSTDKRNSIIADLLDELVIIEVEEDINNKDKSPETKTSFFDEYDRSIGNKPQNNNISTVTSKPATSPQQGMKVDLKIVQPKLQNQLISMAKQSIGENETLYVALKGAFKEYLFCTDKKVYIVKKGFMTGHTFGSGDFKMPYSNITNAEVDYHFASGYFEISSGGLQNKRLNYWSKDPNQDPAKQPNCISITTDKELFKSASNFIMEMIAKQHSQTATSTAVNVVTEKSAAEQIKEFKELLDMGIITEEEFSAKKKQLLGI